MDLKRATLEAMDGLLAFLNDSPWRERYYFQAQSMLEKLNMPCVLAVAEAQYSERVHQIREGEGTDGR